MTVWPPVRGEVAVRIAACAVCLGGTVSELTEGRGADHMFVAAEAASLIGIGSSLLRRGGSLVIVGLPPAGVIVSPDLDELISERFEFDRINDAIGSAKEGAQLRPVLIFPDFRR